MKLKWLFLIGLVAVAVVLCWQFYLLKHVGEGHLTVKQKGEAVVISWSGEIKPPMRRRIISAIKEWDEKTNHFVIDLNSFGGLNNEGTELINFFKRKKHIYKIDTLVASQNECQSMCVPIFLQGQRRTAAADALFMFHKPTLFNARTGEAISNSSLESHHAVRKFVRRHFVNSPMNPAWLAKLEKAWIGKDIYKSGKQLVEENSGIVTDLE